MILSVRQLTDQIQQHHRACESEARSSLEHAWKVGMLLYELKERMRHGEWMKWLERRAPFAERTARLYMQVYDNRSRIEQNGNGVADLSLRQFASSIAQPRARRLSPLPPLPTADPREQRFVDSHTRKPSPLPSLSPCPPVPLSPCPAPPPPPPPIEERTPQWIAGQIVLHTPKPALVYVILELLGCLNRVELNTLYAAVARQQAKVK